MKKYSVILLAILLCGCGNASKNVSTNIPVIEKNIDTNYFGGVGEIKYTERVNARNALYDDENVYITFENQGLLKLDNKDNLSIICQNENCSHQSLLCKACTNFSEYFVFNNKLYRYYSEFNENYLLPIAEGHIIDVEANEIVFDNSIPEDMDEQKKLDDSSQIYYVRVINDDYIKVEGHRHAYILDKNFDIVCMYDDVGKFPWGTLYGDKYYYINDLKQLVNIDIKTNEKEIIISDIECFLGGAYENYIFFSDKKSLYRYSLTNKELISIADDVIMFSVYDGYIYADSGTHENKRIMDIEGNLIKDFTEYSNMTCCDSFKKIGDKIYCTYEDGIAVMNEDGTNYKCITWDTKEKN